MDGARLLRRVAVHLRWRADRAGRELDAVVRNLRAPLSLEPTFLVIGVMKGGTTALYRYLRQHPAIGVSTRKEVRYFKLDYRRGPAWYRGHFPTRAFRRRVRKRMGIEPAIGEASPGYLMDPRIPQRVYDHNPNLKLVALLRDPVSRAYSHHQHQCRMGLEHLSFEEALEAEGAHIAVERERMPAEPAHKSEFRRREPKSYLVFGRYIEHIERWLEVFPRDQLLLLCSEDLYKNPASVMSDVVGFLELPAWNDWQFDVWNRGRYEPMKDSTREFLAAYYEEPNRRLYEFLGRDLGWTRPLAADSRGESL